MAVQGDIVGGFTLVRRLGAGGMGETWEAVRQVGSDFEQRVAIKLPNPEVLKQPEGRDLLRREASLAASLRHPNIASVIDWSEERGYIVCELVEGASLGSVLQEAPSHRLPGPMLVHVLAQVGRGLSHAHRRLLRGEPSPVVHRDMSPSNLVVDYDGNVKIVDFGIAKTVGSADRSKSVKGKLAYMAPEQATGHTPSPAFDQYALGVIAYEAAAGERPNDGGHDGQTLKNILNGRHVPVGKRAPELPSGLAEVIERMLALDPGERFPSMDAVIEALEPFTPPLGIHRSLAALVQRAHPPETIVQEDGRYVSRPVTFELSSREPHWGSALRLPVMHSPGPFALATPRPLATPAPARSTPMPESVAATIFDAQARASRPPRAYAIAGLVAAGLAFLGWGAWHVLSPAATPDRLAALGSVRVEHAGQKAAAAPGVGAPATKPPATEPPVPAAPRAPETPPLAQAPGAVAVPPTDGAALHAVALGAEALSTPARGRSSHARQAKPGQPAGDAVLVQVKVFPWGRVWIDGTVRGSVPPILHARLRPGSHTIAAGQEKPAETRNVEVSEGEAPLISFDLSR